jgi:NRPS condensation-like uncharacterized protein
MMHNGRMAPPSKGVRIQVTTRLPVQVHRQAVAEARMRGWTLNDLIIASLRATERGERPEQVVRQNIRIYDDDGEVIGRV